MNRFEDGISCGWSIFVKEKRRKIERERERERAGDSERNNSASVLIVKDSRIAWLCHEHAVRI